jgi:hypothetical protein
VTSPGQPAPPTPGGSRGELPGIEWARAILLGIRDTAHDVLDEGREGARKAYDEYWRRFEAKTKTRRRRKQG